MVKVSLARTQWLGYKQSFGIENYKCLQKSTFSLLKWGDSAPALLKHEELAKPALSLEMVAGAGVAASESSRAVSSLPVVRSVFLSAGNIKVIGVTTRFKNKKSFFGSRGSHDISKAYVLWDFIPGDPVTVNGMGAWALEIFRWSHLTTQSGKFHSVEANKEQYYCFYSDFLGN